MNTDRFGGLELFITSALKLLRELLTLEKDQAYSIRGDSKGNSYHNNLEYWLPMARKHFTLASCNSSV